MLGSACLGAALWTVLPPAFAQAAGAIAEQGDEANMLVLAVQLDKETLTDSLPGLEQGGRVFLPLGELARALTLSIRTNPAQRSASGSIIDDSRGFGLNVAAGTVNIDGDERKFDPKLVIVEEDDIYVASELLSQWLPLDFELVMASLTLNVKPRERLPVQDRIARDKRGDFSRGARAAPQDPGYPPYHEPYRLLRVPTIDQTLSVNASRNDEEIETGARYSAYLTGDLLGLESSLYYSATDSGGSDLRFTAGRHDPDAGLLGPLRARTALVGAVPLPAVQNVMTSAVSGNGFLLSNRPIVQPSAFSTHTLQGDLPPGWDVELFFNDALVGFQRSRADGKYEFPDLPLIYGPNEFRLVFHGPLGQVRVEKQTFMRFRPPVASGEFVYTVAASRDDSGAQRSVALFDAGLGSHVVASGGVVGRQPVGLERTDYGVLGVRAYTDIGMVGAEVIRDSDGGRMAELTGETRVSGVSVAMASAVAERFSGAGFANVADPVRRRDRVRLDGSLPLGANKRLPFALHATRHTRESDAVELDLMGRIAAYVAGTAMSNTMFWRQFDQTKTAQGVFHASRRFAGVGVLGEVNYDVRPEWRTTSVSLGVDKQLENGITWSAGVTKPADSRAQFSGSVAKRLGDFGLSAGVSYLGNGNVQLGFQLFMAAGYEPRYRDFFTDAQPLANTGMASVRLFLDQNVNGIADPGEPGIPNIGFRVNQGLNPARTDERGMALVQRMPVHVHANLGIDTTTFEDPQWSAQVQGLKLKPRPGVVSVIDVPVITTGEIDGTTYLWEDGKSRPIGDLRLELVERASGKVVKTVTSASDGFYVVETVPPGEYLLRVAREQLKRLRLTDTGSRVLTMGRNGEVVGGIDFYIIRDFDPSQR